MTETADYRSWRSGWILRVLMLALLILTLTLAVVAGMGHGWRTAGIVVLTVPSVAYYGVATWQHARQPRPPKFP